MKTRRRSPNYPVIDLEKAIERAEALHNKHDTVSVPIGEAHERWKYKPGSSIAEQTVAALRAYGLLNVTGKVKARTVSVSQVGDRIIRKAPDRDKLIRDAAVLPKIHAELWGKYNEKGLPHDDVIRTYLLWGREEGPFNKDVVDGVISRFRSTIAFAELGKYDIIDVGERQAVDETESSTVPRGPMKSLATISEGRVIRPREEPSGDEGAAVTCDLPGGNLIEIRLRHKVSPSDFEYVKKVFEVAEFALVDHSRHDPNPLDDSDNKSTEAQPND